MIETESYIFYFGTYFVKSCLFYPEIDLKNFVNFVKEMMTEIETYLFYLETHFVREMMIVGI
jgi:hypothetical protein